MISNQFITGITTSVQTCLFFQRKPMNVLCDINPLQAGKKGTLNHTNGRNP